MVTTLSAVMPLKISGEREARSLRHAANGLRLLDHFWTGRDPLSLTVVAPPAECDAIAGTLRSTSRIAVTVRDEREILAHAHLYPDLHGWFRQMAIKLGFAQIAETPYYLVLDADVLTCRPFDADTFFRDGSAITEWEPAGVHEDWWINAARALGTPPPPVATEALFVTPNIFAVDIARACLTALRRAGGRPWDVHFAASVSYPGRQLSEFALYTQVGLRTGLLPLLHWGRDMPEAWPRLHAHNHLWYRTGHGLDRYQPLEWLSRTPHGHFMVVQSTTGFDPDAVMAKFAPLLGQPVTRSASGVPA